MSTGTTRPNLGRFGSFGFAKQVAANTPLPATHFLRYNGGSALTATSIRTRDNFANGSLWTMAERVQGRVFQGKTINFEVDHASLEEILNVMLGGTLTAGVLTPSVLNFLPNMPLTPVTIEANIPGNPLKIVDAQFYNLQMSMNARANFTGQVGFHGAKILPLNPVTPAVIPVQNIYQYRDHYIKYGGVNQNPETSSLTLDIPIAPIDAARGNTPLLANDIVGYERNGPVQLGGQFSLSGVPAGLLAAYQTGTFAALEWTLAKFAADGTTLEKEIAFVVPNAELNMVEPPLGMDRIVTPITWSAVSLAGEPSFSLRIK